MVQKQNIQTYESDSDFLCALEEYGLSVGQISEVYDHEKQHFDRARELGYSAKYAIQLTDSGFIPSVFLEDVSSIPRSDLIDIISAPNILSSGDRAYLRKLETAPDVLRQENNAPYVH